MCLYAPRAAQRKSWAKRAADRALETESTRSHVRVPQTRSTPPSKTARTTATATQGVRPVLMWCRSVRLVAALLPTSPEAIKGRQPDGYLLCAGWVRRQGLNPNPCVPQRR